MNNYRKIKKIVNGRNAIDGAGVKLVRVFGHDDVKEFDPFLLLDGFDSTNPEDYIKGFPWHPHRGIETVTYLVKGEIEHGDSLGNKGKILDGDCQWMTAGSGIIHQEMPQASDRILGAQLWVNLPQKDKMTEPKYRDIKSNMIPCINEENIDIKIISGEYKGIKGPLQGNYVDTLYMDVEITGDAEWEIETDENLKVFVYILIGNGIFKSSDEEREISEKNVVLFTKGEKLWVKGLEKGIRFLLIGGKPLNESIAWGGPIVMNTKDELNLAFRELDEGNFIKNR